MHRQPAADWHLLPHKVEQPPVAIARAQLGAPRGPRGQGALEALGLDDGGGSVASKAELAYAEMYGKEDNDAANGGPKANSPPEAPVEEAPVDEAPVEEEPVAVQEESGGKKKLSKAERKRLKKGGCEEEELEEKVEEKVDEPKGEEETVASAFGKKKKRDGKNDPRRRCRRG